MSITISKALKIKNRIAGDLAKLQEVVRRENSRRNDNPSTIDVKAVLDEVITTRHRLICLKAAIAQASSPIATSLATLTEAKGYINWLTSIHAREGVEKESYGDQVETYTWTAYLNREQLDKAIASVQRTIETTQDAIDEYNAKTPVNWE